MIVTPALATANNGNWQMATRRARMRSPAYCVDIADQWSAGSETLMIALHARRSASSMAAWRETNTGRSYWPSLETDLYRDIHTDASWRSCPRCKDSRARCWAMKLSGRRRSVCGDCHVDPNLVVTSRSLPAASRRLKMVAVGDVAAGPAAAKVDTQARTSRVSTRVFEMPAPSKVVLPGDHCAALRYRRR